MCACTKDNFVLQILYICRCVRVQAQTIVGEMVHARLHAFMRQGLCVDRYMSVYDVFYYYFFGLEGGFGEMNSPSTYSYVVYTSVCYASHVKTY